MVMDTIRAEERRKAAYLNYDYSVSKLTLAEVLEVDLEHIEQYNRKVITGGELDCLFHWGVLPHRLFDRLQSVV